MQSLASRMVEPQDQLDNFLVLNGLDADAQIKPGDRVKVISQ